MEERQHAPWTEVFEERVREAFDAETKGKKTMQMYLLHLMKFVAHLYRDGLRDYKKEWGYNEIQEFLNSMEGLSPKFKEEISWEMQAIYVIGKKTGDSHEHKAINTRPDGSCFYQALFYNMLWSCPGEIENIHTVHGLKRLIMIRLYGKKALRTNLKAKRDELETRKKAGQTRRQMRELNRKINFFDGLKEHLGFTKINGKVGSDNAKFYNTVNNGFIEQAFDIQVIIYNHVKGDGPGQAKLSRFCHKKVETFTGRPVAIFLWIGRHFYVLSREPWITQGLMGEDGFGVEGKIVPPTIKFSHFNGSSIMPYLSMCLMCNKLVLSD